MKKIDVGEIWLPEELIERVEAHRKMMIEANPQIKKELESASFGMILSDYLSKGMR